MLRRLPSPLQRTLSCLGLGLLAVSALHACGGDKPQPPPAAAPSGIVGSACNPDGNDCVDDGTCLRALTGGAAFSPIADPLPAPLGYCSRECATHDECGERGVCFGRGLLGGGGECRRACTSQRDCDEGQECASAGELASSLLPDTCQPLPAPQRLRDDQAGKACSDDSACGEGFCAEAEHPGGGYCSGLCVSDEHCGKNGKCVSGLYGSSGTCQETCEHDKDCQQDLMGWGCGLDGLCVREPDPLSNVGASCSNERGSKDCGTGSCRTKDLFGVSYPDGYCVGLCDEDEDCGAEGVCINSLTCFRRCDSAADCRDGYACRVHPQALGADREAMVCFPESPEASDSAREHRHNQR